jgi:hypothetical protein
MNAIYDSEVCFFDTESKSIIDFAMPNGKSSVFGETLTQMQSRYPHVVMLDYVNAQKQKDLADREHYCHEPIEIDESRFSEMLNILPPVRWTTRADSESFLMSEMLCGTLTECYMRIGDRYFEVCVDICTHDHDALVECMLLDSRVKGSINA